MDRKIDFGQRKSYAIAHSQAFLKDQRQINRHLFGTKTLYGKTESFFLSTDGFF